MKPSFCGEDPSAVDVRYPCVSDEEVGSEHSGPDLQASTSSESEFGQRGFIDSSSSEEECPIPPKTDARMDPAVQKAIRSRHQRRKRSNILRAKVVRFNLESPTIPINLCAEVEDDVADKDDAKRAF